MLNQQLICDKVELGPVSKDFVLVGSDSVVSTALEFSLTPRQLRFCAQGFLASIKKIPIFRSDLILTQV